MPIYQTIKTYESGFYNAVNNDRVYNAEDISDAYFGLLTNGVKPNDDGTISTDLQVQFVSGMQIRVAVGKGLFGYKKFRNKSNYAITLDNAGVSNRYDCVIVKADNTDSVRDTTIYVKSLNHTPTISDLIRNDNVNEYLLGYVTIAAQSVYISQANITDTRSNASLCGFVQGCYNQVDGTAITAQWNAAFNDWFDDVKDNFLATATLIRAYSNDYITQVANERIINIGIPQYNRNLDTLLVYINGSLLPSGRFTINSNTQITLSLALPVIGTQVTFEVWKSIDGSQAQTVVAEVGELQNWRNNKVDKMLEHHYYCNGSTDNIQISVLVRSYFSTLNENARVRLVIHGTFGATTAARGEGLSNNVYGWFNFYNASRPCRVTVDFSDCSQVIIPIPNGSHNVIFYGAYIDVVGANVVAENLQSIVKIYHSTISNAYFHANNCRFIISGYADSYISNNGNLINCYGKVINETGNSWCFNSSKCVRLFGGEYLAYYNESSGTTSAVGYMSSNSMSLFASGVSCPNVSITGYDQSWAWYSESANKLTAIGTITQNPSYIEDVIVNEDGANTRNILGTIPLNMPNII